MGKSKSYWCLLIFVFFFGLSSAFFWYLGYDILYGDSPTAGSIGAAFGQAIGLAVAGILIWGIAIALSVIFLILLIVYIVKKAKN